GVGRALPATARCAGGRGPGGGRPRGGPPPVAAGALVAVAGVILWANIALAGDVAAWLGVPRWQGIAAAVGAGWLLTTWRAAGRAAPVLWLAGAVALALPLAELAREAGARPPAPRGRAAPQTALRF